METIEDSNICKIMPTISCFVGNPVNNVKVKITALWDSASNQTLLKRKIAHRLGLRCRPVTLCLNLAKGETSRTTYEKEGVIFLQSLDMQYTSPTFSCITCTSVIEDLEPVQFDPKKHHDLKQINFTQSFPQKRPVGIDLLIDTLIFAKLTSGPTANQPSFASPTVLETKLGPSLWGGYRLNECERGTQSVPLSRKPLCATVTRLPSPSATTMPELARFFTLQDIGIADFVPEALTAEEQLAEDMFKKFTFYDTERRRFFTRLPQRYEDLSTKLESNEKAAVRMAFATRKKAIRKGTLPQINKVYREMVEGGAARRLRPDEIRPPGVTFHFLPSHIVERPESTSTPFRPVFAANSKCPNTKLSLNQVLLCGPNKLPQILGLILKLRTNRYFFVCDLKRMYHQILLSEPSNYLVQYVWFDEKTGELAYFRHISLVFGLVCSTFIAIAVCHLAADMWGKQYPLAAHEIKHNMYADDLTGACQDQNKAIACIKQTVQLFDHCSMIPHKWAASPSFLLDEAGIPLESRSTKEEIKILGCLWNQPKDLLCFDFSHVLDDHKKGQTDTPRIVLSTLSKLYDAGTGILAPFVLCGKLIVQETFKRKLKWDQNLPDDLRERFSVFKDEIRHLNKLSIPRLAIDFDDHTKPWLCCFADASQTIATAACAYIVTKTRARLLCSKCRINPLPKTEGEPRASTPRLELISAVLAAKLVAYMLKSVSEDTFSKIRLMTDSTVTYFRIQSTSSRYKTWVKHRIDTILHHTKASDWRHLSGTHNPADILSRSMLASSLAESKLWRHGPTFILKEDEATWPSFKALSKKEALKCMELDLEELAAQKIVGAAARSFRAHPSLPLLAERIGKWGRLVRITAYVFRFLLIKAPKLTQYTTIFADSPLNVTGMLKLSELEVASKFWIRVAQRTSFEKEIGIKNGQYIIKEGSCLIQMNAFFDKQLLLRCKTRFGRSNLLPDFTTKPIILPKDSIFTEKLILHLHVSYGHATLSTMHYLLMRQYAVQNTKRTISRILKFCGVKGCVKIRPLPIPPNADLPTERVDANPSLIWRFISVDFTGAFTYRSELTCDCSAPERKLYILVACDFYSRSVHLECLRDKSTEHFFFALQKLFNRRGIPQQIYCDCDKSFRRCDADLRRLYKSINFKTIEEKMAQKSVEFKYGCPLFSNDKGVIESMVKLLKTSLKTTLANNSKLQFAHFESICSEQELLINSRPLGIIDDNIDDPDATISPNSICHGRELTPLPFDRQHISKLPEEYKSFTRLQLYRRNLTIAAFKKWRKHYLFLTNALRFSRPGEPSPLKPGLVVLLKTDSGINGKGQRWSLAKIEATRVDSDKYIRRLRLRTPKGGVVDRHVSHVSLLPHTIREINEERERNKLAAAHETSASPSTAT